MARGGGGGGGRVRQTRTRARAGATPATGRQRVGAVINRGRQALANFIAPRAALPPGNRGGALAPLSPQLPRFPNSRFPGNPPGAGGALAPLRLQRGGRQRAAGAVTRGVRAAGGTRADARNIRGVGGTSASEGQNNTRRGAGRAGNRLVRQVTTRANRPALPPGVTGGALAVR